MSWTSRMAMKLYPLAHDLIRKPVPTFRDHALVGSQVDFLHARAFLDLLRRPGLQHFTEMQHRYLIGDVEHYVHVMLDQQDRELGIELHQKARHLCGLRSEER